MLIIIFIRSKYIASIAQKTIKIQSRTFITTTWLHEPAEIGINLIAAMEESHYQNLGIQRALTYL